MLSRTVKVCQNKQITGQIPIRDSKEYKQQAIKFDLKKVQGHVSCGLDDGRP